MKKRILLVLAAAAVTAFAGTPSSQGSPCDPSRFDCGEPVDTSAPRAGLFVVERTPAGVRVEGYAVDGDTTGPIDARVLIDDVEVATVTADRLDSSPLHLGYHGFDDVVPARVGSQVCVEPIDYDPAGGPGVPAERSCLSFAVRVDPFGGFDSLTVEPGALRLRGWALDPDTASPLTVQVYRDGAFVAAGSANVQRSDLAWPAGYAGYGVAHGFELVVPILEGEHTLCVYAINEGAGSVNSLLGCKSYRPPVAPALSDVERGWSDDGPWAFVKGADRSEDEDGFRIERVIDGLKASKWTVMGTRAPQFGTGRSVAFMDAGLTSGANYCYRVVAWNALGSSPSNVRCVVALRPPLPRATDITLSPATTSIRVTWTDNTTEEDTYVIKYGEWGKADLVDVAVGAHVGTGTVAYTVSGLKPETRYCFWVVVRKTGHGDAGHLGNAACADTLALPPAIDRLDVSPSQVQPCFPTTIRISWKVTSASRVVLYREGTQIRDLAAPAGQATWESSTTDPETRDATTSYRLVLYDRSGMVAGERFASVSANSRLPLVRSVKLRNVRTYPLDVWFYNKLDRPVTFAGTVGTDETIEIPLPHCQEVRLKGLDPNGVAMWELFGILGHSSGIVASQDTY